MGTPANIGSYELEIAISASREKTWRVMTEQIHQWWLPDFHIVGPESVMSFEACAGGQLLETMPDGASLLWFTVQMVVPGETLYLVGHCAPDWGGPYLSMLKLTLSATDDGCVIKVSDSIMGNVKDGQLQSLNDGWKQLFTNGLKKLVEVS